MRHAQTAERSSEAAEGPPDFDIDWPYQPEDQDSHSVAAAVDHSHRSLPVAEEGGCCNRKVLPATMVCCRIGHIAAEEGTRTPAVEDILGYTAAHIEVAANMTEVEDRS